MIINRVGQAPFEIKRGDRVRFMDQNVTVIGISKARKEVKILSDGTRNGGYWVNMYYVYPPIPEETDITMGEKLSEVLKEFNANNEPPGGWSEADKVKG